MPTSMRARAHERPRMLERHSCSTRQVGDRDPGPIQAQLREPERVKKMAVEMQTFLAQELQERADKSAEVPWRASAVGSSLAEIKTASG